MTRLADTFRTPEARVWRTVVAVDITDSTKMKEDQGEAGWLNTYGWFFDMLAETIASTGGVIVKYLGDGVMAVFGDDKVTEAINWSIVVQEEMAAARARNLVKCACSIGIASGEVIEFDPPLGGKDYIGTVVDRAFRLCSAANANAIFVDTDTVAGASMTKVMSKAGRSTATKRTPAEYQGKEQGVRLKGFSSPVTYHEILWETARFSVKPQLATELSETKTIAPGPVTSDPQLVHRSEWLYGRVSSLNSRFGFIDGPSSESFWFNDDYLFNTHQSLIVGADVWFIALEPLGATKNRRASAIIVNGSTLTGVFSKIFQKGFGFAELKSKSGDTHDIFVSLGPTVADWKDGDTVAFTVKMGKKGLTGFDARKP